MLCEPAAAGGQGRTAWPADGSYSLGATVASPLALQSCAACASPACARETTCQFSKKKRETTCRRWHALTPCSLFLSAEFSPFSSSLGAALVASGRPAACYSSDIWIYDPQIYMCCVWRSGVCTLTDRFIFSLWNLQIPQGAERLCIGTVVTHALYINSASFMYGQWLLVDVCAWQRIRIICWRIILRKKGNWMCVAN